jgi:hypothetical protein
VTDSGGVDSMLQFQLERRDDVMKCCRKMKRRQRAHLDSMRRKRNMTWQNDIARRRGATRERKGRRQR